MFRLRSGRATDMLLRRLRLASPAALLLLGSAALAEHYTLPLFVTSTTPGSMQGVVRILNDSEESGSVEIHAIDDAGARFGPASFMLNGRAAAEFDAEELASGNAMRGLSGGIGTRSGDVRLEIGTDLSIVPTAYVRAADGTLSAMHDTVRPEATAHGSGGYRYDVTIFNPSTDAMQASRLRLINSGDGPASVTIEGRDDTGASASGGSVQLTLPAGGARTLTAQQLEVGDDGVVNLTVAIGTTGRVGPSTLTGRLGAGVGRWRLSVSSDRLIEVVNVVTSSLGYMNNLSTTGAPGAAPVDHAAFSERFGERGIEYRRGQDRYTFAAQGNDRFTETGESGGIAYSTAGNFRYQAVRPDAALVTLLYDDGDVCRSNLYFESATDGRFASLCSDSGSAAGLWSGGSWTTTALDPVEPTPEVPTGTDPEGDCYPGLIVRIGASCTYPGTTGEFTVNDRGRGQFLTRLAGIRFNIRNETINGQVYDFGASHQGDGVWLINRVAGRTQAPSFDEAANPGDRTYMRGTAIEPLTLPAASGGDTPLRYSLAPEVPGLSFDASARRLAGTPTSAGTYDMSYTVTDTDGDADSLSFTITVEGDSGDGDGDGDGDGETGVEPGNPIAIETLRCTGVATGPSAVLLAVVGRARALDSLTNVRAAAYGNGTLVGTQVLGDMPAGATRSFAITGEVNTSADDITCTARVFFIPSNPIRGAESISIDRLVAPL